MLVLKESFLRFYLWSALFYDPVLGFVAHRSNSCTEAEEEPEEEKENMLRLNLHDLIPKSGQQPQHVTTCFKS